MSHDNELFELCKEVYNRFPEWSDFPDDHHWITERGVIGYKRNGTAPLYTSDYLLEKLPKKVERDEKKLWISIYPMDSRGAWGTGYSDDDGPSNLDYCGVWADGDKPVLKALLKLVTALHDTGELK